MTLEQKFTYLLAKKLKGEDVKPEMDTLSEQELVEFKKWVAKKRRPPNLKYGRKAELSAPKMPRVIKNLFYTDSYIGSQGSLIPVASDCPCVSLFDFCESVSSSSLRFASWASLAAC